MKNRRNKIDVQTKLRAITTGKAISVEEAVKQSGVVGLRTTVYFSNGEVEQSFNFFKEGKKKAQQILGGNK